MYEDCTWLQYFNHPSCRQRVQRRSFRDGCEMLVFGEMQSAGIVYPRAITSAICLAGAIGSLKKLSQALKAFVNPLSYAFRNS